MLPVDIVISLKGDIGLRGLLRNRDDETTTMTGHDWLQKKVDHIKVESRFAMTKFFGDLTRFRTCPVILTNDCIRLAPDVG